VIRFIPGLVGALAAYVAMALIDWIDSGWFHTAVFFGIYLFVTIAIDRAMSGYRKPAA
jgi:hypothetical protein